MAPIRERLLRLLTLSSSVYANERDDIFVRSKPHEETPPEIIYVFDHSVMEMFMALDDETRKYSASFHLKEWRAAKSKPEDFEAEWESINRQSATIASEYLLGGGLPGQDEARLFYMTAGHYEEFCGAVDRRLEESQKRARTIDSAAALENLRAAIETDQSDRMIGHDPKLQTDTRKLFGRNAKREGAALEFQRTRLIARALAEAEDVVRVKQLERITRPETLDRIMPLELRFPPMDDHKALQREWRDWLIEADGLRAARTRRARGSGNLRRDADAMAHVQWVARTQLSDRERIVFVTGDSLLQLAYAKWHKDAFLKDPGEPYVLRSIQQFAPILNLNDMETGVTNASRLTEMLRDALETPLVAFNLSKERLRLASNHGTSKDEQATLGDAVQNSGRADLALRLDGVFESYGAIEPFFAHRFTSAWVRHSGAAFTSIATACREFERIAIGLNTALIERRASAITADLAGWDKGADLTEFARNYIEGLLSGVARQSIDLWFNVALKDLTHRHSGVTFISRTPRALRLSLPPADAQTDRRSLLKVVDEWLDGDRIPPELTSDAFQSNKHLVFAVVAVAALRLGWWSRAHRFTELAMSAAQYLPQGELIGGGNRETQNPGEHEDYYHELSYLRAVTCRLRIGERGPADFIGDDIWAAFLDEGLLMLRKCEDFHRAKQEDRLMLRAISERVALRGFYTGWLPLLNRRLGSGVGRLKRRGYSRPRAVAEYESLLVDLRTAIDLAAREGDHASPDSDDGLLIQVQANVAAAYAVSVLTAEYSGDLFVRVLGLDRIEAVIRWWRDLEEQALLAETQEKLPLLVQLQLALFFRDFDGPRLASSEARQTPILRLDQELIEIMTAEWAAIPDGLF